MRTFYEYIKETYDPEVANQTMRKYGIWTHKNNFIYDQDSEGRASAVWLDFPNQSEGVKKIALSHLKPGEKLVDFDHDGEFMRLVMRSDGAYYAQYTDNIVNLLPDEYDDDEDQFSLVPIPEINWKELTNWSWMPVSWKNAIKKKIPQAQISLRDDKQYWFGPKFDVPTQKLLHNMTRVAKEEATESNFLVLADWLEENKYYDVSKYIRKSVQNIKKDYEKAAPTFAAFPSARYSVKEMFELLGDYLERQLV